MHQIDQTATDRVMTAFGLLQAGVSTEFYLAATALAVLLTLGSRRIYFELQRSIAVAQILIVVASVVILPALLSITVSAAEGRTRRTERDLTVVTWSVRVLLWLVGGFVVFKMFQLLHLSRRWLRRRKPWKEQQLLPTQRTNLRQVLRPLLEPPEQGSAGRLIPFYGEWGDGKTFVLRYLVDTIEAARRSDLGAALLWRLRLGTRNVGTDQSAATFVLQELAGLDVELVPLATAWIDVWQHSTDADLHTAIVSDILSHPTHARGLRWLAYPPVLSSRMRLQRLVAGTGSGAVEVAFESPRLRYQSELERIMGRSGTRTLIVLDEIDRAPPDVTQAALTLCRRSLDVPHALIVVPFVESVLHEKVFSEWYPKLDDVETFLWKPISDRLSRDGYVLGRSLESLGIGPRSNAHEPTMAFDKPGTATGDSLLANREADEPYRSWRRDVTAAVLGRSDQAERFRIYREAAEKFLSGRRIHVSRPLLVDSFRTLMGFEVIEPEITSFCTQFGPESANPKELTAEAIDAAVVHVRVLSGGLVVQNLRVFVTDFIDSLHQVESVLDRYNTTGLPPDDLGRVIALIVLELYEGGGGMT